jgi:hypothetical protein
LLHDLRDKLEDVPAEDQPLIQQSAIMATATAAQDARLKKRTLNHLYNEHLTWLRLALALTVRRAEIEQKVLANLLRLNHARSRQAIQPGLKAVAPVSRPVADSPHDLRSWRYTSRAFSGSP